MVCEEYLGAELRSPRDGLFAKFGIEKGLMERPDCWKLRPRSRPREDGTRRITVDIRTTSQSSDIDLTAGEAAELMLELGLALEQAARDERSATYDLPHLEAVSGGRA